MRINRLSRIGIDIDNFNHLKLLKTYYNMKKITDIVIVKKTGHGYHVMGYFPNRTVKENMDVRMALGDCKGRIGLDDMRLSIGRDDCTETLFYEKNIRGVITSEEDYNIDSKPFWGDVVYLKKGKKNG